MRILFAADHAGLALKNELCAFVRDELGFAVEDMGAHTEDSEDDFPTYIEPAAQAVAKDPGNTRAIILGGSGQGEAMCANRIRGVRAAVFYGGSQEIVKLSREHNDANVLSLGARFVSGEEAKRAVKIWLATEPSPDAKYHRRNAMLDQ